MDLAEMIYLAAVQCGACVDSEFASVAAGGQANRGTIHDAQGIGMRQVLPEQRGLDCTQSRTNTH
jgi:hypothetical protein